MNRVVEWIGLAVLVFATTAAGDDWRIDVEAGPAFVGMNDIRVPGDGGTRFSFNEDLDADVSAFWRARVEWQFADRHTVSILAAPLRFTANGTFDRPVEFFGRTFGADSTIRAYYRFDSYRLTYRYTLLERPAYRFGLGFTAKIRDAEIRLNDAIDAVKKTNRGFVPLVNFHFDWVPADAWTLRLSGDALAAPQGRAEDVLVAALYRVQRNLDIKAGYRLLEGGVDNDEVYNFNLTHYIVLGLVLHT